MRRLHERHCAVAAGVPLLRIFWSSPVLLLFDTGRYAHAQARESLSVNARDVPFQGFFTPFSEQPLSQRGSP
jgi:hypothetical protein